MAAPPAPDHRWIHGPVADLMIGCGGLYAVGFAILLFTHESASAFHLGYLLPLAMLLISTPHYGGTLVRVYGSREQRDKYVFFTVYVTAALVAWFAVGTWNALIGSLMVTLYLSWSPWHYSGQNYGIALMFLGRAGVKVSPGAKWALWLTFVLAFVLALINLHVARPPTYYAHGLGEASVGFMPVGLPRGIVFTLFVSVFVAYVGCLLATAVMLLRVASARALLPAAMIVLSQALWFVVPFAAIEFLRVGPDNPTNVFLQSAILWVAIAHAAQYLWITSYYARGTSEWRGYGAYFARTFASSSVVWTLPVIVFAPFALGNVTFGEGLILLLAALVNLHHFILDGAIWKLRNSRIASILIRDEASAGQRATPIEPGRWRVGLYLGTALIVGCAGLHIAWTVSGDLLLPIALQQGRARTAAWIADTWAWGGLDLPATRVEAGNLLLAEGDPEAAMEEYRKAVERYPRAARAHLQLGRLMVERGEFKEGIAHLERATELQPNDEIARRQLETARKRRVVVEAYERRES